MLADVTLHQDGMHQPFVHTGRGHARYQLEVDQLLQQAGFGHHEAHAKSRCDGLGEAAHVDDTPELIGTRQSDGAARHEICGNVVLHHEETVPLRQAQHLEGLRGAVAGAGGVVQLRVGEVELRLMLAQQALQGRHVGTRRRHGHAHELKATQTQGGKQIAVAWVIHEDRVPRLCEPSGDQIQALARAVGEQDLVR